jgi:hypothetical protein
VNITGEKTAKSGASKRATTASISALATSPLATGLLAHLREVRGVEACTEAGALAYREVPFHADLNEVGGFQPPIEARHQLFAPIAPHEWPTRYRRIAGHYMGVV